MQSDSKYSQIWQTVAAIPCGKVASYGLVADLAGLPGRARFVSRALRAAPESMQLPWHRVLRSDGSIAFERDSAAAREQIERLRSEGVELRGRRVNLALYLWRPELGELMALDF